MKPIISFIAIVGGAGLAQIAGVPLDSPAVHAMASGAFVWAAGRVLKIEARIAAIETSIRRIGGKLW